MITSGAHYLHMSKKDLVEAAVAFYLDARHEEMQAGMRELPSELARRPPRMQRNRMVPGYQS